MEQKYHRSMTCQSNEREEMNSVHLKRQNLDIYDHDQVNYSLILIQRFIHFPVRKSSEWEPPRLP